MSLTARLHYLIEILVDAGLPAIERLAPGLATVEIDQMTAAAGIELGPETRECSRSWEVLRRLHRGSFSRFQPAGRRWRHRVS